METFTLRTFDMMNLYLTIVLTHSKHTAVLAVLEQSIPWDGLAKFFSTVHRNVMV
jgi:hypothetical protein